jgi:hypothetical protein
MTVPRLNAFTLVDLVNIKLYLQVLTFDFGNVSWWNKAIQQIVLTCSTLFSNSFTYVISLVINFQNLARGVYCFATGFYMCKKSVWIVQKWQLKKKLHRSHYFLYEVSANPGPHYKPTCAKKNKNKLKNVLKNENPIVERTMMLLASWTRNGRGSYCGSSVGAWFDAHGRAAGERG